MKLISKSIVFEIGMTEVSEKRSGFNNSSNN